MSDFSLNLLCKYCLQYVHVCKVYYIGMDRSIDSFFGNGVVPVGDGIFVEKIQYCIV